MPRSKSSNHTVTGDAKEAWHLIERARASGVDVASVSVGNCRIELRPRTAAPGPREDDQPGAGPAPGIYDQFGSELYRQMVRGTGRRAPAQDTVPGEDFQPAIEAE